MVEIKLKEKDVDSLKIEDTQFDRRKKLTNMDIVNMRFERDLRNIGYDDLAKKYNVSVDTVKYHLVMGYKERKNKMRVKYGFKPRDYKKDKEDRINYKVKLIEKGDVIFQVKG